MTKTTPGAMRATRGPWEVEDRTRVIGGDIRATVNGRGHVRSLPLTEGK